MTAEHHQSFDAAGAGAPAAGASGTGAGVCADFGAAACFLPAAGADPVAGRGEGNGALAGVDATERGAGAGVVPGSGVMMLTGGVEAAEGKSALVGLPVGMVGASVATGPGGGGGAFHDGA